MGLFEKKYCSVCGEKIGLLGNRKLEDGNLCKDCAAKLSPWFSERRSSTVEQIMEQLRFREANQEELAVFQPTRTVGKYGKIIVDENQKKFIITHSNNWKNNNPDVLSTSQITGTRKDIIEHKTEEKQKDKEGHLVSYNPPRYKYSYDFKLTVFVNHPYFDDMWINYNSSSIEDVRPKADAVSERKGLITDPSLHGGEYKKYEKELDELAEFVEGLRESSGEAVQEKAPVKCPHCGASTIPDAKGCCEYCGLPVGQTEE